MLFKKYVIAGITLAALTTLSACRSEEEEPKPTEPPAATLYNPQTDSLTLKTDSVKIVFAAPGKPSESLHCNLDDIYPAFNYTRQYTVTASAQVCPKQGDTGCKTVTITTDKNATGQIIVPHAAWGIDVSAGIGGEMRTDLGFYADPLKEIMTFELPETEKVEIWAFAFKPTADLNAKIGSAAGDSLKSISYFLPCGAKSSQRKSVN